MISRMKNTLWFPLALGMCAVALWLVQALGLTLVQVRGPSMMPSYADGQILFVNRLAYGLPRPIIGDYLWIWKAPGLGDPVVVKKPGSSDWVVKRVAGLPGMPLAIRDHQLQVGGRQAALDPAEEYWLAACSQVPGGTLFLLGDNLADSNDSRDWGFVPIGDVVGRSLF